MHLVIGAEICWICGNEKARNVIFDQSMNETIILHFCLCCIFKPLFHSVQGRKTLSFIFKSSFRIRPKNKCTACPNRRTILCVSCLLLFRTTCCVAAQIFSGECLLIHTGTQFGQIGRASSNTFMWNYLWVVSVKLSDGTGRHWVQVVLWRCWCWQ